MHPIDDETVRTLWVTTALFGVWGASVTGLASWMASEICDARRRAARIRSWLTLLAKGATQTDAGPHKSERR